MPDTVYTPYDPAAVITGTTGPRAKNIASSATPAINADDTDFLSITALAVPITGLVFTGHPGDGKKVSLRIKDDGTARAIALGTAVIDGSVAKPTTTTQGKVLRIDLEYDKVAAKYTVERATSRA